MDYKDLYPKLDKVLDSISQEELYNFARSYALYNTDMALALVEKYWKPDTTDYRQIVDACFVHPFIVSTKWRESLDWNAVTEDVMTLMQRIREDKDGKDIIGAAQMSLYLLVRACEEFEKDHPYKVPYNEVWIAHWSPLRDCLSECSKIVCELLVDGEDIDDDTQRGLIGEVAVQVKNLKNSPLINMDFFWEDIQEKVLSPRRYITYLNNKIKNGYSYDKEKCFGRKLRFLDKMGKRKDALAAIDEMVIGDKDTPCRAPAIDLLIEWGEYEKALEMLRSTKEFDAYSFDDTKRKLVYVLDQIGDKSRLIEVLKEEFAKACNKQMYFDKLRELLDNKAWNKFVDDLLADVDSTFEHDYDKIEAQIYVERKLYDRLIVFCKRNSMDWKENLKEYGCFMLLDDQLELLRGTAEHMKKCLLDAKRSKDYVFHVTSIQDMINTCDGGRIVAKELVAFIYEHYGNRPALTGMLGQLKGL